jgi:hypothetical protein
MLLTLRIPLVDLRPFYGPDYPKGIRLPATWSEDHDFVRYFGPVTKRIQGPVDPWPSERAFCRYDKALRFSSSYSYLIQRQIPELRFLGVKRRLYPATSRNDLFHADIQIIVRGPKHIPEHDRWWRGQEEGATRFNLVDTVQAILNIPTIVRSPGNVLSHQSVGRLGRPIAEAFDAATTVGPPTGKVFPGTPAIAIELEDYDEVLATWEGPWQFEHGLLLSGRPVAFEGRAINVFVLRPVRTPSKHTRSLRIHILRLHAERQFLRHVARALIADGFIDSCASEQLDNIQYSLNQCLIALTRARKYGLSTPEIAAAFLADQSLSGHELETLIERVQTFRPIINRRLRQLQQLSNDVERRWRAFAELDQNGKNFIYVKEAHVSKYDLRGSQVGAVGDNSSAADFSFGSQLNLEAMLPNDAEVLQVALRTLRKHLADRLLADSIIEIETEEISPTEIGDAIGALSEAERAISDKDTPRAESALRRSGQWLAAFAQGIGVDLAAAAIRKALHLP